jgi:predicted dehydrogenase
MGNDPLRLGVIGLGRSWRRRYRSALLDLPRQFVVTALCDPIWDRAQQEAKVVGGEPVAGPAALFERRDLDAVLFLAGSWQQLWPLELAARRGLPTLCRFAGRGLSEDAPALELARQSGTPFMVDLAPRFAPATARLRELIDDTLGRPRVLLCDVLSARSARAGIALELIDWCGYLLNELPGSVLASPASGDDFSAVVLRWADGRVAALRRMRTAGGCEGVSIRVIAERGIARASLPNGVAWTDGAIKHAQRLAPTRAMPVLEAFYEGVVAGKMPGPGLEDVARLQEIVQGKPREK